MEFYNLTIDNIYNQEWRAILKGEENRKYQIVNTLNNGRKLEDVEFFDMHLINIQLPEDRRDTNPLELDLIYWANDITLDAFSPNKSSCILVSLKLKELLLRYQFHEHFCYTVRLFNLDGSSFKEYYLLQITGNWFNYVDYKNSTFVLRERPSRKIVENIDGNGYFEDYDSYNEKRSDYLVNKNMFLDYGKVRLIVDYDILWGIPNQLRVNEVIKREIENFDVNGVQLTPINTPEYILKSE